MAQTSPRTASTLVRRSACRGETSPLSHAGCGSSCIFALLGARLHSRWTFTATEVDEYSLGYARSNVARNSLHDRIHLVRACVCVCVCACVMM